jgi:hypothetical protein
MKIERFYILNKGKFADTIKKWADGRQIDVVEFSGGSELFESIQGGLLFHINHNLSKELIDLHKGIEENNLPVHKIDVNGTLAATVSNFTMWLERNKPENILVLGGEEVAKSENLRRFLNALVEVKENT